jgi:hypothetical protein
MFTSQNAEGEQNMRKKCIAIWLLTSLTFISLVHFIEAITVTILNTPIRLIQLYPFINQALKTMTPSTYFYITAFSTALLWAITCLVAFHNPVEAYLNKHQTDETKLQESGYILDRMCDTVESDHQTLTQLSDMMHNMQAQVKEIQFSKQMKENSPKQPEPQEIKQAQIKTSTSQQTGARPSQTATAIQKTRTSLPKGTFSAAKKTNGIQKSKNTSSSITKTFGSRKQSMPAYPLS